MKTRYYKYEYDECVTYVKTLQGEEGDDNPRYYREITLWSNNEYDKHDVGKKMMVNPADRISTYIDNGDVRDQCVEITEDDYFLEMI